MISKLAATLKFCREQGIRVVYTARVHRSDGCDVGLYDDLYPPIAERSALVDGTPGVEIYPELAPAPGEHVVKKHRYSGFFATDLDLILREWGIDSVVISGTTKVAFHKATLTILAFSTAHVMTVEEFRGLVRPEASLRAA